MERSWALNIVLLEPHHPDANSLAVFLCTGAVQNRAKWRRPEGSPCRTRDANVK